MAKTKSYSADSSEISDTTINSGAETLKAEAVKAAETLKTETIKAETMRTESMKTGAEALKTGAEAVKDGFEKAAKGYDQLVSFGKDNAEAVMKSANAAGKGIETINSEVFAYARKTVEEGVSATKAILASKSVDEAFQLQSEFGKAVFETYVDELAKFGDLALATARDAAAPLQARIAAFVDLMRAA